MHDHRHDSDTADGQVEFDLNAASLTSSRVELRLLQYAAYFQIMPMPWTAMLRYGPTLVASAARLLAAADSSKRREQNETITGRLDQLENTSAESARLLREVAEQIQVLAAAQEQTARKCRIAILLALAATVIGVGAGILAIVR
jgi:hypothetical protein